MRAIKITILILFLISISIYKTNALTIKIGSIAPERSPWGTALKELAQEWAKITDGKIRLSIYHGGIVGSELDMIRKMRMGILGGASLTNIGITQIYPDIYVLNTPFLFNSDKELNYILDKIRSTFEREVEKKGFKIIIWTMAGWVNLFTKNPVFLPEDLKNHKISFSTATPKMEQAWKKSGYQIIPNELKDMMMALQSGMVNAFYLPPLIAGSGQYFPLAPNMCSLKVSPLLGGIILSNKTWGEIPNQYKKSMLSITNKISERLYKETKKIEQDTIKMMQEHGLVINHVPLDAVGKWRAEAAKGMDVLIGNAFSRKIYSQVLKYLKNYRKNYDK
ncbi:MAG: TRAP transporter substrate-binding protein DctP [Spirochaetota bacterium]|nr:TRAP transporter substrate-binding protein DctP [Spirochaetota bacterium]